MRDNNCILCGAWIPEGVRICRKCAMEENSAGNQYCIYCASCLYLEGKLICDRRDEEMTMNHARRMNHCKDFSLSPMGHAITGKPYRPQKWKMDRGYQDKKGGQ